MNFRLGHHSRSKRAFNLTEVSLALALVAFSMTTILGLLPVGLRTVQQTAIEQSISRISDQIQAEVQSLPLTAGTGGIGDLTSQTLHFDAQGNRLEQGNPSSLSPTYYEVRFVLDDLLLPDGAQNVPDSYRDHSKRILVQVSYPYGVAEPTMISLPIFISN